MTADGRGWRPLLINKHAPLGNHLYVLNSSVHSTEELFSLLFNSTEEQNTIQQHPTLNIIAIELRCHCINFHPPVQGSSSARLYAESDTFYLLSEMPVGVLTTFMDVFSVPIFLRRLVHALQPLSKLFVGPPRLLSSVCFVDVRALRPSSIHIDGTAFLSFSVELLPKIGT